MIFLNPAGAPELACDACGCRWFDRITGSCYECGTLVSLEAQAEYRQALASFAAGRPLSQPPASDRARDEPI